VGSSNTGFQHPPAPDRDGIVAANFLDAARFGMPANAAKLDVDSHLMAAYVRH